MPITREQQREKYEADDRYHAPADDFGNFYSLRNPHGLYFETRRLRAFFQLLNAEKVTLADKRILDVGCHHGLYSNLFAYLRKDADGVTGSDYIEDFLVDARRINGSVRYVQQDLYNLSLPPGSFDLVLLNYVYSCIPPEDMPRIAADLTALLDAGGSILFFDFHHSPTFRFLADLAGRDKDPLPTFDDARLGVLFRDCRVVTSTTLVPAAWHRMIKAGFPHFVIDALEKVMMRRYYAALLQKR